MDEELFLQEDPGTNGLERSQKEYNMEDSKEDIKTL